MTVVEWGFFIIQAVLFSFMLAILTDKYMKIKDAKKSNNLYVSPENKRRLGDLRKRMDASEKQFNNEYNEILKDVKKETRKRNGKKR